MDEADYAGDLADREIEWVLSNRRAEAESRRSLASAGRQFCVDCGEPIALLRLKQVPDAQRCHECQCDLERWERAVARKGADEDA